MLDTKWREKEQEWLELDVLIQTVKVECVCTHAPTAMVLAKKEEQYAQLAGEIRRRSLCALNAEVWGG